MGIKDGKSEGRCGIPPTVCSTNEECDEGEECKIKEGNTEGVCKRERGDKPEDRRRLGGKKGNKPKGPSCTSDDGCVGDEICMIKDGETDGRCGVPRTPCTNNENCEEGEECRIKEGNTEGVCKRQRVDKPRCTSSDECAVEGEICMIKDGKSGGRRGVPRTPCTN